MKTAIVHDELLRRGGAERVVISLHKLYPNATIFTSAYEPDSTFEYFKSCAIKTTFLNKWVRNEKQLMLLFFPFGMLAMKSLNLKGYDLIILSSAHGAQYIRKPKGAKVINYAHYVFRLVWEPESYAWFQNSLIRTITKPTFYFLRKLDKWLNVNADYTIFNSKRTQKTYLEVFNGLKNYSVINPPVSLDQFSPTDQVGDFYLVVSRMEPYKRVDLVIKAFQSLSDKKLIVVGSGTQKSVLQQMASGHDNISFEEGVSQERLRDLYAICKALIFPQVEDFGITPLEANASGRPVIAYGEGGVLETMIPYGRSNPTAVFFDEQNADSLISAIHLFESVHFLQEDCLNNVKRFEQKYFHEKIQESVDRLN